MKKIGYRSFEDRSLIICLVIVVPYIILTFLIIFFKTIDDFKDVSAVYGAWIGIAVGYFFGSRPAQLLTEKVDELLHNIDLSVYEYERALQMVPTQSL